LDRGSVAPEKAVPMNQQDIQELHSLTPSAIIELFTLDGSTAGSSIYYNFYDGTSNNYKDLVFGGTSYSAYPIKIEQVEYDGKGTLPRPKLSASNINGFLSLILLGNENLIGARVIRTRVFARCLDAVNFPDGINPWGTPDPTAIISTDTYYINRKVAENPDIVQFELATPIEIDNVQLPRRIMLANSCPFIYRDTDTCSFSGDPVTDKNNKSFGAGGYSLTLTAKGAWDAGTTYNAGDFVYMVSTLLQTAGSKIFYVCMTNSTVGEAYKPGISDRWVADACTRQLRACKLRFPNGALRFGGFPGIASSKYLS
jgi:lambda family phage minor tail protein L